VTKPDGYDRIFDTLEGSPENPEELGRELAEEFLERGAGDFLKR
jgi:porphobilinogen deaminase